MRWTASLWLMLAALLLAAGPAAAQARLAFGATTEPSPGGPAAIGEHARGCLAGGEALSARAPNLVVMRPSRSRFYGHPTLIAFIERLAADLVAVRGRDLLVGDLAQPRGGPMTSGHRSHQSGLDVDLWYRPAPAAGAIDVERLSALPVVRPGTLEIDDERFAAFNVDTMLERAARDPAVARLFVHPAIKRELCRRGGGADWLAKVRPWWGHDHHVHVRLACPKDDAACIDQAPPPAGDGCDETLAWWFTDEPWRPSTGTARTPLALADLPPACRALVGR